MVDSSNPPRGLIGYECLIIGLMMSLASYTVSFGTAHSEKFCMADAIRNSINETKLLICITKDANLEIAFYYLGFAGNGLLAISAILLSNLKFHFRFTKEKRLENPGFEKKPEGENNLGNVISFNDTETRQESIESGNIIVRNGFTYYPDGSRVDSHGTIR